MQIDKRHLGRLAMTALVVAGLAACGGRGAQGAGGQGATATTPAASPVVRASVAAPSQPDDGQAPSAEPSATPAATPAATPVPSLDLPDLSGVAGEINGIDTALNDDASAGPQEGNH